MGNGLGVGSPTHALPGFDTGAGGVVHVTRQPALDRVSDWGIFRNDDDPSRRVQLVTSSELGSAVLLWAMHPEANTGLRVTLDGRSRGFAFDTQVASCIAYYLVDLILELPDETVTIRAS